MGEGGSASRSTQRQAAYPGKHRVMAIPVQVLQHQVREATQPHSALSALSAPPQNFGPPAVAVYARAYRDWCVLRDELAFYSQ
eukprot:1962341-Pyramimonas_sp.AAC.1